MTLSGLKFNEDIVSSS